MQTRQLNRQVMKSNNSFKLTRYFSITSMVAVIIAAVALSWIFYTTAVEELMHQSEAGNITLTRAVANAILPKFRSRNQQLLDIDEVMYEKEIKKHDISIRRLITGTPVIKIKLFDLQGSIIYSTSANEVGQRKPSDYPNSLAIKDGKVSSTISQRSEFDSYRGKLENVRVLSSYVPVRNPKTGVPEGVIETYSDVTALYERIVSSQLKIIIAVIGIFFLMYATLYLIIHHAESILIKQNNDKENALEKIEYINAQLQSARDDAVKANQVKSNFLANMSHEIRTPLTAIIGFTEALLQQDNLASDKRMFYTSTIFKSAKHLLNIINDILDLSRIKSGRMDIEPSNVSIFEIIDEASSMVELIAANKGIHLSSEFEYPIPEYICTDPVRLKQILYNFCSNALKFTDSGEIKISTLYSLENNNLEISITDTGIGMSQEFITQLFKPFGQADSSLTKRFAGTGLGLYLANVLTKKLNGTLKVSSTLGEGSCFTLLLPAGYIAGNKLLDRCPELAISNNDSIKNHIETGNIRGKVLLAEDNEQNQQLVSMYLGQTNAQLTIVENGEQAVETALSSNFDLILMDLQMPIMDGLEAISLLRSSGYKDPIVALTASAMLDSKKRCLEAGCDDYISKPIDSKILFQMLSVYLENNTTELPEAGSDNKQFSDIHSELTNRFLLKLPEMKKDITEALDSENWGKLMALTHDLKGLGGSFGFPELTEKSGHINMLIQKNELNNINSFIMDLLGTIHQIIENKKLAS
jgi:signal transduction histidine kinase/DNA-binding NarL/FixJ family response regulator